MQNSSHFRIVGVALAIAFVSAGCGLFNKQTNINANLNSNADGSVGIEADAMAQATPFAFAEQNESSIAGTVRIYDLDGRAKVIISTTGNPVNVAQPAHIHTGSCAQLGGVKYGLANVVNGQSETVLEVSSAMIAAELPLAINIHKSEEESGTYVACVDLTSDLVVDGGSENTNTDSNTNVNANVNATINANLNTNLNANVNLNTNVSAQVKVFAVAGDNFKFDTEEIRVKKGDTVTINFTSTSGFHDWVIDEFNAKTAQVNTGGSTSVTFVADKSGEFEYYCSVGQHRQMGMVGTLIVE